MLATFQEQKTIHNPLALIPDFVMPSQFTRGHLLTGEQRLMLRILGDAIETYFHVVRVTSDKTSEDARARRQKEAEDWLFSNEDSYLYSFLSICQYVGIEPDMIRNNLSNIGAVLMANHQGRPKPNRPIKWHKKRKLTVLRQERVCSLCQRTIRQGETYRMTYASLNVKCACEDCVEKVSAQQAA